MLGCTPVQIHPPGYEVDQASKLPGVVENYPRVVGMSTGVAASGPSGTHDGSGTECFAIDDLTLRLTTALDAFTEAASVPSPFDTYHSNHASDPSNPKSIFPKRTQSDWCELEGYIANLRRVDDSFPSRIPQGFMDVALSQLPTPLNLTNTAFVSSGVFGVMFPYIKTLCVPVLGILPPAIVYGYPFMVDTQTLDAHETAFPSQIRHIAVRNCLVTREFAYVVLVPYSAAGIPLHDKHPCYVLQSPKICIAITQHRPVDELRSDIPRLMGGPSTRIERWVNVLASIEGTMHFLTRQRQAIAGAVDRNVSGLCPGMSGCTCRECLVHLDHTDLINQNRRAC